MLHLHNIAYIPRANAMLFFTFMPYVFDAIFPSSSLLLSIPTYLYESGLEAFTEATHKDFNDFLSWIMCFRILGQSKYHFTYDIVL